MKFLAVVLLLLAAASPLQAQPRTRLTLSGFSGAFGNTNLVDFTAGAKQSAALVYLVEITRDDAARTTTVLVRSNSATLGASKPVAHLEWSRADQPGTWVPMTTSDVAIESRPMVTNGTSWSNSIFLRVLLDFGTETLGAMSTVLTFTLQVTAP